MRTDFRWDLAITHGGTELPGFISQYFNDPHRQILLIGGAGFDPRTTLVAEALTAAVQARISALLIQESRPDPDPVLAELAGENLTRLEEAIPDHTVLPVDIFGTDNSVVGGRRAATQLHQQDLSTATDIVVDISALSVGTSFPIIRYLIEQIHAGQATYNLHVMVAHQPELDARIHAVPADTAVHVHGFNGGLTLSTGTTQPARLWLPQLAHGRGTTLRRIHETLNPEEVCPVLPFPAGHPRLGDELLEELLETDGFPWHIDARSIVHADEDDPLDLYRTIMRLHSLRIPVFAEVGGSQLIVSPVGSKVMALGSLLAALERDLPVVYIEDFSYELRGNLDLDLNPPELMHVWLEGEPYPSDRPAMRRIDHE